MSNCTEWSEGIGHRDRKVWNPIEQQTCHSEMGSKSLVPKRVAWASTLARVVELKTRARVLAHATQTMELLWSIRVDEVRRREFPDRYYDSIRGGFDS